MFGFGWGRCPFHTAWPLIGGVESVDPDPTALALWRESSLSGEPVGGRFVLLALRRRHGPWGEIGGEGVGVGKAIEGPECHMACANFGWIDRLAAPWGWERAGWRPNPPHASSTYPAPKRFKRVWAPSAAPRGYWGLSRPRAASISMVDYQSIHPPLPLSILPLLRPPPTPLQTRRRRALRCSVVG